MKKIGSILKKSRIQKGLTIEEVAFACQIETRQYMHIESNKIYPNDALLEKLYDRLSIDVQALECQKEINEEKARVIMGYILTLFSLLFILSFFMKFGYPRMSTSYPYISKSGFYYVFYIPIDEYISVKVAFSLFVMQFGYYVYRFITKRLSSNIFNIMTILFSVSGVLFIYIGAHREGSPVFTLVFLIILAVLTTLVSLAGLILYPLRHDYLSEKIVVRKFISMGFAIVLGLLFITVIGYLVTDYSDLYISEYFIFAIWIGFSIVTLFLKKSFYEKRLIVTLYLSIPAVTFFLFYIIYSIQTNDEFEYLIMYYCLILMLPVMAVNIDFIIENLKSSVSHFLNAKD